MFGNLGVHILKCPTGRYTFVGSLPETLGKWETASTADVMGGRAKKDGKGNIVTLKFPTFDTLDNALGYATARGVSCAVAPNALPGSK